MDSYEFGRVAPRRGLRRRILRDGAHHGSFAKEDGSGTSWRRDSLRDFALAEDRQLFAIASHGRTSLKCFFGLDRAVFEAIAGHVPLRLS